MEWSTRNSSQPCRQMPLLPLRCWICICIVDRSKLFWPMKTKSRIRIVGIRIRRVARSFAKFSRNGCGMYAWNAALSDSAELFYPASNPDRDGDTTCSGRAGCGGNGGEVPCRPDQGTTGPLAFELEEAAGSECAVRNSPFYRGNSVWFAKRLCRIPWLIRCLTARRIETMSEQN